MPALGRDVAAARRGETGWNPVPGGARMQVLQGQPPPPAYGGSP
jgi:hypothetical protein